MAKRRPVREQSFGAGIVAGASDNDPTTVATLAVIGSTTVYELCSSSRSPPTSKAAVPRSGS